MAPATAHDAVFALRREIARIEGRIAETLDGPGVLHQSCEEPDAIPHGTVLRREGRADAPLRLQTGAERFDAALHGGVPFAGLTEIHGAASRDAGAVLGFTLALLGASSRVDGASKPLLWIGTKEGVAEAGLPYLAGLYRLYGIGPEHLILSRGDRAADALWIAGEAAGLPSLGAVLIELRGSPSALDLNATRRLQVRAREAGRPVLLLRQNAVSEPTAAPTRLHVAPAPSALRETLAGPLDGTVGYPAWRVSLSKSANGAAPSDFTLEWDFDANSFRERTERETALPGALVSVSRGGADQARPDGAGLAQTRSEPAALGHEPARGERPAHRVRRQAG